MQCQQERAAAGDSGCEREIPPLATGSTRERKRRRDYRRLLNPRDPPLGTAELGEQPEGENEPEYRSPAHVEDLITLLVDVSGEAVDQVDQPEVDRQRSNGDDQAHRLQPSVARNARHATTLRLAVRRRAEVSRAAYCPGVS